MEPLIRIVLQEIVSLEGDCLSSNRCSMCPFKNKCLPTFVKKPISKATRHSLALDALLEEAITGDGLADLYIEDRIKEETE